MRGVTARAPKLLVLTPIHRVRIGEGLDGVRIEARGPGVVLGSLGIRVVWGSLDVVIWRRFGDGARCRALFIGLRGLAWASAPLAPRTRTTVPLPAALVPPAAPDPAPAPGLALSLRVTPPTPPGADP